MSATEKDTDSLKSENRPTPSVFPHQFTTEERRRGAARTAEVRREKAKSHSQRLRERLEALETELVDSALEQAKKDYRALMALYDRAYGTPAKAEPERIELDVGSSEARGVSLADIVGGLGGEAEKLSLSQDNAASNGETPAEGLDQADHGGT